jgi:4'-phosphopantetheinyl transferase EntD
LNAPPEPEILHPMLPAGVFCADIEDRGQAVRLRDAERNCVRQSAEKRIRDFALGRECAHRALLRLGAPADAILRRDNGAPHWPEGLVGSITHTRGYAAAVVAPAALFLGIGVDAERIEELGGAVERRLFLPEELAAMELSPPEMRKVFAMTLFSAKEACFKACSPKVVVRNFREIRIHSCNGGFVADVGGLQLRGRAHVAGDLVVTVVTLPAG